MVYVNTMPKAKKQRRAKKGDVQCFSVKSSDNFHDDYYLHDDLGSNLSLQRLNDAKLSKINCIQAPQLRAEGSGSNQEPHLLLAR
jgi:hypothetical protein